MLLTISYKYSTVSIMSSPEIVRPEIEPVVFRAAYSAVVNKIIELGSTELTMAEDERKWAFINLPNDLLGDTVVGHETTITGTERGVGHFIRLAAFNESLGMVADQQEIIDIRLFANGDNTVPYPGVPENYPEGVGHLRGLIWFSRSGTIMADFGHGTNPDGNPGIQQRMEELLIPFGLNSNIFEENQSFHYDSAAALALADNLPRLGSTS
jgi:hypothetical protein